MEKFNKKIVIVISIILLIGIFLFSLSIQNKYERWEIRERFINNLGRECSDAVSDSYEKYTMASAYLKSIDLKVEEETYILIVDRCVKFSEEK